MTILRTVLAATGLIAVLAPSAEARPRPSDPADRMVAKINQVRERHHLRPLRIAPVLERGSRRHARHLIRTATLRHASGYGARFSRSGEVLAQQRGGDLSPRRPVANWLTSPAHRQLILDRSFRYVGAGPARSSSGGTTVWVVRFGQH